MSIISVDLSIQSSSFAVYDGNKTKLYVYTNKTKKSFRIDTPTIKLTVIPHPKDLPEDDFQRYMVLADGLFYYMYQNLCDDTKVYLEGYSYASKGLVFNISEFCALFKRQLYPHYIPTIVPPSEWKKAIVGKGNATKEEVADYIRYIAYPHDSRVVELGEFNDRQCKAKNSDMYDAISIGLAHNKKVKKD